MTSSDHSMAGRPRGGLAATRRSLVAALAGLASGRPRRRASPVARPRGSWLAEPKNAVLILLGGVLLIGGGRAWLRSRRARAALARLDDPGVAPEEVEAASAHGRVALMELFRLLGTSEQPEIRQAAGRALATLWAADELIAEEEKAVVRRGFEVSWRARRRYPRALKAPISIEVTYGVPFLVEGGPGVGPSNLEWSHRIVGAERASLEVDSPWRPGPGRGAFTLDPGDFPADGPHRLVLRARTRAAGLTSSWELDLPHVPFAWEFDPRLDVEAILASADDARAAALARAVRLGRPESPPEAPPSFLDVGDDLALRDPPMLLVATPLPCDLAHAVQLEFEGIAGRIGAGAIVVSGQGAPGSDPTSARAFPIAPPAGIAPVGLDRPGERRLRAILTPDPDLGWADPDVRSLWPGSIETDWVTVRVVRR